MKKQSLFQQALDAEKKRKRKLKRRDRVTHENVRTADGQTFKDIKNVGK